MSCVSAAATRNGMTDRQVALSDVAVPPPEGVFSIVARGGVADHLIMTPNGAKTMSLYCDETAPTLWRIATEQRQGSTE
jgi:hypothetical protein